ncbi:sulfatase family protein [Mangrovibacterium diazotrophicum]|uniref:Arylsulfatase A-like enzyme n=1 Tax=Mangrovibacterium diazotrophicum TaxID=1261403 RepID=A0A419W694_9BACT|nr:sulfatase [Mangrovibacterium diazotrophicum]RKD90991.1 arylsulfatase A-like enzyme [Mangrovibacterium diazotrophicum]
MKYDRNLVQFIWLAFGLVVLFSSCVQQEPEPQRPNILFIMSDDHAYQAISAYSDRLIETPNIDRLADQGMLFTNACVTNSICAPSRATILTGKHTHINGKIDNNFPFDTTNVTFPQLFHQAGYQTAMFGKLHFGNSPKGFDEFMILPDQGDYYNPEFITNKGDTTIMGYVTDIITDLTLKWLKKDRKADQPFLLMYLHKAPHREWIPAPRHYKEFTKRTFPEPETLFDDYSGRGTAAHTAEMNLLKHMTVSADNKIYPEVADELGIKEPSEWGKHVFRQKYARLKPEQKAQWDSVYGPINEQFKQNYPAMNDSDFMRWKYQRYMQDYLGCIAAVDENVGRVLDYLKESGLDKNTIVVYTSDQGFYLGEHGWFDKRFIYDESFKTPLLVRWPEHIAPGSRSDEMVQNLDFAQTFLDAAGIEAPADMQGESLMPLLTGHPEQWTRDAVYYQYYEYPGFHMVKRHYGIVTKEYKLVHFYYDVDEWELYDRKNDPFELKNVYDDPAYASVQKELHQKLDELRRYYKDSDELDQFYIEKYKEKGLIK